MNGSTTVATLGMFAKHWQPGRVKTRLAATLGNDSAAAIQQAFVATQLARFAGTADERLLVVTPPDAEPHFLPLAGSAWRIVVQGEGNLGDRLQRFFSDALAPGRRIVLIGSDSPDLPADLIVQAFDALQRTDVVLGPASDGGYYLLGVRGLAPPIFAGIAWSTSRVYEQTRARLQEAGIPFQVLPDWHDIDDEKDLRALLSRLDDSSSLDRPLAELRSMLHRVLSDRR